MSAKGHGAVQQGVEADEAEHNGASQLNSSVLRTVASATEAIGMTGRDSTFGVGQSCSSAVAPSVSLADTMLVVRQRLKAKGSVRSRA